MNSMNHPQRSVDREHASSSRGRNPSRYQAASSSLAGGGGGGDGDGGAVRSRSQTNANTPRRKGNPQSSSPSTERSPQRQEGQQSSAASCHSSTNACSVGSESTNGGGGPLLTPLSTLSTILATHSAHERTALMLFRQSHALHLHATERSSLAMEKLRVAQAEVEHAATAEEFAREELERAAVQKTAAQDALHAICKRVRKLSKGLVNKRVRLAGLNKNAQWNGRSGTILELLTDGEDAGRWKVRLDSEWRGRDADGEMNRHVDTESDGTDGDQQGGVMNMVMAKAENLALVDEDGVGFGGAFGLFGEHASGRSQRRTASRSRSASSTRKPRPDQNACNDHTSPQGRSRDPSINERDDPVAARSQWQRSASRSRAASSTREPQRKQNPWNEHTSPQGRSRDPSINARNDPVVVTPGSQGSRSPHRNLVPATYYRTEDGRYHESLSPPNRMHPQHHHAPPGPKQTRQASPSKKQPLVNHHPPNQPSGKQPSPHHASQQKRQVSPPRKQISVNHHPNQTSGKRRGPTENPTRNFSPSKLISPIKRSPSNDSERLSSAFSRMLLSPVSFAPVSFTTESTGNFRQWTQGGDSQHRDSDSFEQWMQRGDNDFQHHNQERQRQHVWQNQRQNDDGSSGDVISIAGSFFNQVTSLKNDSFLSSHNGEESVDNYNEWDEYAPDPQLQTYPSPLENATTSSTTADGHKLPHIVILPVDEDDHGNPFLSPGYLSSSPPNCVGVQNAGFSHVNGVYLLAYPKDENGNAIVDDGGELDMPPLYFKDGPPTLLSDNRYYDMCILRINCPDSVDHVIWFLARVDVDPDCLDVKFSDCYYYCRMLRTDDGCGGEREGGCLSPPTRGWNLPKLPKGVEMLSIAKSRSFSPAISLNHGGRGLGIVPRPQTASARREEDGTGSI